MFCTTGLPALSSLLALSLYGTCIAAPVTNQTLDNVTIPIGASPSARMFWSNVNTVRAKENGYHTNYFFSFLGARSINPRGSTSFRWFLLERMFLGFEGTLHDQPAGFIVHYNYRSDGGWLRSGPFGEPLDQTRADAAKSWERLGFLSAEMEKRFDPEKCIERILQDPDEQAVPALKNGPWEAYGLSSCGDWGRTGQLDVNHICFVLTKDMVGHAAYDITDDTIHYIETFKDDLETVLDTANGTVVPNSSDSSLSIEKNLTNTEVGASTS